MNLRWVHAVLILLSAILAVLFGVWCLALLRAAGWDRKPDRRHHVVRRVVRPGPLRFVVPAKTRMLR